MLDKIKNNVIVEKIGTVIVIPLKYFIALV